jgi:hypothetical protein
MPARVPNADAISCAMALGALRSRRASSKATGRTEIAELPLGGYSSEMFGSASDGSE